MKMPYCRKTFAAMIAIAGLVLCPAAYADDDDDWGDDPGDDPGMEGPQPGDPEYCDWYGHSWISEGSDPPSCETPGYDVYCCVNCGEHDFRNEVPPLGHKFVNGRCIRCNKGQITYTFVPAVAPTCTTQGNVAYLLGSDNNWYDPTTTNQVYWITLSALGHDWTAWTTNTPPTCTTAGQKTHSCTRAGCTASETQTIPALGHDWTAWVTNALPTCTTAGSKTRSCSRADCSETETQSIPALGHDYSAWTTNVFPTCTSPGSEGSLCTRCGMGETQAIPALGHDWTAWTVVTPASYAAPGEEERDCLRCNAHETRVLAILHHSTFSVGGSGNTFTIVRTGEGTNLAETVYYRAVGLSAYAGQNFTSKSGSLTFAPGQIVTNVTVSTRTPSNNAYKFQSGTTRAYRFELLDAGGFRLDGKDRTITAGTSVSTNGTFNIKDVTIQTAEYTADDDGYDKNGYKSVSSNAYFSVAAPKAYFQHVGAQLRMTLSMQAKENDDAYEYLQLLFDNTSTCDNRSGASNGDPGTPNLSSYMAGFEMDTGSKDSTYRTYTFPVTNVANNAGATNPWGYSSTGKYPLSKQKFNTTTSSRATDGRIVVPLNFSSIVLRLNASGSSGSDEWAAKNVKAHVQAVDSAVPTLLGATVSPGPYHRGNTVTVSLAFSEIVVTKPSSGFFLKTSWGMLGYEGGTCGNVLTFSGKIADGTTDNTPLSVTGFSGLTSITDLAGNTFGGSVSRSITASVAPSVDYAIAYDLAGGTLPLNEDPNPDVYNYDSDIITLTNPVRPGYTFVGWSGTGFSGTRTTVNISAHSHGDRAYTAHWDAIITPSYPSYLGLPADSADDTEEDEEIRANYDAWAAQYGYDALGVNETAYLLDVAPAAVTNGVAALKIVELGVTNIPMSECGDFAMIARVMGYSGDTLPFRRLLLASDVTPLKNGFYDALTLCNGYPVLHIGTDLSAPRSEWLETGWPVWVEDGRAEIMCPDLILDKYRERVATLTGKPCPALFLSVSLEPRPPDSSAFSNMILEEVNPNGSEWMVP